MELSRFAKNILETIREAIIVLDKNLIVIYANRSFYKTFKVTSNKTLGNFIFDLGNQQWDIPGLRKLLEEIISINVKFENYEVEHKFPDIGNKIMLLNAQRIFHTEAASEMIMLAIEDITDRMEIERELKYSEELFRRLFETSKDGLLLLDKKDNAIVKVNPAMLELLKISSKDLIGKKLTEVGIFKDKKLMEIAYQKVNDFGFIFFDNMRLERKTGGKLLIELYLIDRAKLIQCNIRNITERKKTEEDMLKSQKLESIGLLAGGIAHDFNNLLTAILGNIILAKLRIDRESGAYQYLEAANKASNRASELTQQLLTFSRGGSLRKKPASIEKIIKESNILALSGSGIKTDYLISKDLWPVEVDEGQLNQMFINLINNAKQALPDGGTIKIQAENIILEEKEVIPLKSGKYVKISIEDKGMGISEENISKIFDPYFTTKQKGKGIGLAVVFSIVKSHNGHITVVSTPDMGTTFILYFPASEEKITQVKKKGKRSFKGKGRLLIMDDEEMVRNVLGELLKNLDYEIGYAVEGAEAIKLYTRAQRSGHPFDAIIMDLTIPGGMGGKIAIEKLKEIDPKVKAVVSSGYSNDPIMANFNNYGFKAAISKPYTIMEIGKIIQKVLMEEEDAQ